MHNLETLFIVMCANQITFWSLEILVLYIVTTFYFNLGSAGRWLQNSKNHLSGEKPGICWGLPGSVQHIWCQECPGFLDSAILFSIKINFLPNIQTKKSFYKYYMHVYIGIFLWNKYVLTYFVYIWKVGDSDFWIIMLYQLLEPAIIFYFPLHPDVDLNGYCSNILDI